MISRNLNVETVPEIGGEERKNGGGGEFNYDIL
jgi:hypothetical protein